MKPNDRLKMLMEAVGIDQCDLAKEADVSQPSIHRMINGEQNMNWKVLKVLRKKYRADINLFFDK